VSKKSNVAVVGATGAVGECMLSILAERKFPVDRVYALASSRSAGKKVDFNCGTLTVQALEEFDFSQVQIGLFSPGASVSAIYAPKAAEAGCVVVDNTSQFRYDKDIPLVVPEVNPHAIAQYKNRGIIANPNCSTIQLVVALKPIHDAVGIERINVATYQSVSGTGKEAIEELGAERIGHGVRVLEDENILALAREHQTAFEVCVTSNYQSGVVASLETHPLPAMHEKGLNVTINTDDPSISRITLSHEYYTACEELMMPQNTMKKCIVAAANAGFLVENEKDTLVQQLNKDLKL